jgi:mono/diheme cytochrome c family protein
VHWLIAVLLAGLVAGQPARATSDSPTRIARGQYLVTAGGCVTCHTADREDAVPFAGGRELRTDFGVFYAPNITPDPETGIGGWTDRDLGRALRHGRAPDGSLYYPVFPYPSYAGLRDEDVAAMGAYLRSLAPVRQAAPPHELAWFLSTRLVMYGWNLLNFSGAVFRPDDERDAEWNRGAYLVRHLGHCGECHTPRSSLGAVDRARELAGNEAGPDGDPVPNITPSTRDGIGSWTMADIELFLEIGMLPDGDFTGAAMGDVISDNTGKLTPGDRRAIAAYLRALPAIDSPVVRQLP